MEKKIKFWLLLLVGLCIFIPPFLFSVVTQALMGVFSPYGILFATQFLGWFFLYCYLMYRSVYREAKPKYPIVPPEGRTDIYLPRTDIPRPIHEDARRYPESKHKKMKRWGKKRKVKKK